MNDQQAFPLGANEYGGHGSEPGMTLRDYFAAKALQGLLSDQTCSLTTEKFASCAYEYADAMLAERSKGE